MEGAHVVYLPSPEPHPLQSRLLFAGFRTLITYSMPLLPHRQAFFYSAWLRANEAFMIRMRQACRRECPTACKDILEVLLFLCVESLAYGAEDLYLLTDGPFAIPHLCEECLQRAYRACQKTFPDLPDTLTIHFVDATACELVLSAAA